MEVSAPSEPTTVPHGSRRAQAALCLHKLISLDPNATKTGSHPPSSFGAARLFRSVNRGPTLDSPIQPTGLMSP